MEIKFTINVASDISPDNKHADIIIDYKDDCGPYIRYYSKENKIVLHAPYGYKVLEPDSQQGSFNFEHKKDRVHELVLTPSNGKDCLDSISFERIGFNGKEIRYHLRAYVDLDTPCKTGSSFRTEYSNTDSPCIKLMRKEGIAIKVPLDYDLGKNLIEEFKAFEMRKENYEDEHFLITTPDDPRYTIIGIGFDYGLNYLP